MNKQEKILYTLILLFFVTLFFSSINAVNLIVSGLIVIYSFTLSTFKDKIEVLKQRKYIQAALAFFLLLLVSTLLSDNIDKGFHYFKLRLPLLLFPVSIGLLRFTKDYRDKILLSFSLTTVAVSFACLLYSAYNYFSKNQIDAFYNDNLTLLLEQQSVYISLLVSFAIIILGYLVLFKDVQNKLYLSFAAVFLIFIEYLLGSRINIGVLAVVVVIVMFYYLTSRRKYLEIATLTLGLLMASVVIYKVQPQMLNRFKELSYNKYDYSHMGAESHYGMELTEDQWNGANFRLAAWRCGWEIFTENPIVGVGLGDKKDVLMEKYAQKDFRFAIETNKNVHNNYLDTLYSLGILGFILFVIAWIALPAMQAANQKDWLSFVMIFVLSCAWITEIYFDRSLGGIITGFFIPLLLTTHPQKEK